MGKPGKRSGTSAEINVTETGLAWYSFLMQAMFPERDKKGKEVAYEKASGMCVLSSGSYVTRFSPCEPCSTEGGDPQVLELPCGRQPEQYDL
jgi:hypothetical protein